MAAVDKIEEKRKPEDFIGHRNRIAPLRYAAIPARSNTTRMGGVFLFLRVRKDKKAQFPLPLWKVSYFAQTEKENVVNNAKRFAQFLVKFPLSS